MKKQLQHIISITITMILMFSFFSVTANPVFAENTYILGDIDGDGYITSADARIPLRISAGLEEISTSEQFSSADVDGSGIITAADARRILRASAMLDETVISAIARTSLDCVRSESTVIKMSVENADSVKSTGDTIDVTVSAENVESLQNGNLFFSYNPEYLQFINIKNIQIQGMAITAQGCSTTNDNISFGFAFAEYYSESNIDIATITFEAIKPGDTTIDCAVGTWDGTEVPADCSLPISIHEHDYTSTVTTEPTCSENGYTTYTCVCGDTYTIDDLAATGHTEETVKGYAATCTKAGLTDGEKCSVCNETLTAQTTIAVKGHTKTTVKGYAATCTKAGLTDGEKCSVCDETLSAQEEIPATGHTNEIIKGYAATCTKAGLTDGEKCSVCDETLTTQKEIAMLSHTFGEWTVVTAPTISAEGVEERVCTACGEKETRAIEKLSYIVGDVNNDGEITAADARLALRISAGLDTLESVNTVLEVVDYNNDKQITAADARLILRKSAGLA